MPNEIAEYLLRHGPASSGEVAAALAEALGLSPAAARKRVERRAPPVRALNLPLPKGAAFLYVESQYGSPRFWKKLATTLVASNGSYARAIWALSARGGLIPMAHFASAAGTSTGPRQLSGDVVASRLVTSGLLQDLDVPGLGACVAFARGDSILDQQLPTIRARLIAETILLQAIQDWAAKLGLGSFDSFKLRANAAANTPKVSSFAWDLSAPSYLGPLANWSDPQKPKPGFLVVDVLLTDVAGVDDVSPFLHKCVSLRQVRNVGRCLQMFVANRYSYDALLLLRREGVVPATPETLFGSEVARALVDLTTFLGQTADSAVDPAKFEELFSRLGKAEAAAGTLRGALFEYVVADVVRQLEPAADVTLNKIYRKDGKDAAEVDVRAVIKNRAVRFIECKGLAPGVVLSDAEVDRWLSQRIPIVRAHALLNPDQARLDHHFELWVTGELSENASKKIDAARHAAAKKGYVIDVVLAKDLDKMVAETRDPSLRKVVDQHFLRSPMAISPLELPASKTNLPLPGLAEIGLPLGPKLRDTLPLSESDL